MEPRFFNHGDAITANQLARHVRTVSMEPRFFNHGDQLTSCMQKLASSCRSFNGATVFQPWRREVEFVSERTDGLKAFQWSHGFSTMETRARQGERIQKRQVSMEPRFFNHGDSGPPRAPITVRTDMVSMEPRFFNHGDRIFSGASSASRSDVSMEPRFFNHGDRRLGKQRLAHV